MNTAHPKAKTLVMYLMPAFFTCFASLQSAAGGEGDYYPVRLVVETDSDWSHIEILPPWDKDWHVAEATIIEPKKDQHLIRINGLNINGQPYDDTAIEVEFIVYLKKQTEDLEFIITKGSIGSTTVKAFNYNTDEQSRIGTFTNSESDSSTNPSKYRMSLRKISKYGSVDYTPSRKGGKNRKK